MGRAAGRLVSNTCLELRKESEAGDRDVESLHLGWSEWEQNCDIQAPSRGED